ncbi:hypothetical protein [Streptomyces winkii]|uniref:hypothetical protein n=1 Tax=Streptomyces winkii TaxID=3051178 RepID=UPI0028D611F0|nr:hypothetical protein [Streptomyces sp. DSM 40971]
MTGYVTGAPGTGGAAAVPAAVHEAAPGPVPAATAAPAGDSAPSAPPGAGRARRTAGTRRNPKGQKAARADRSARQGGRARQSRAAQSGLRAGEAVRTAASAPTASTPGPATPDAGPPSATRPRADCTADSAGGLTFDVRSSEVVVGSGRPCDPALLLRLRGGQEPEDTVRLPLGPAEGEVMLRAVLPSIMSLPEGRWDAYLALDGEEPRRLLPGVHDLRSLVDRVPRAGRTWLGVRIPYATKYGNLTVRSWLRWPHAEAGPLRFADGGIVLSGRLYGARLSATARLEAHPRDMAQAPVTVPVLPDGGVTARYGSDDGPSRSLTSTVGTGDPEPAPGFTARLPLDALPSGPRAWDLWLRPGAGEEPVRLARILDDVPDKKQIFSYPPQRVTGPDGAARSVRPYYTLDNDLSVRVSCADAV